MKAILALLVTVSAFSAHALESHYGRASRSGGTVKCALTNNTSNTLDFKYVVFDLTRPGSHGDGNYQVKNRIDQRVRTGEKVVSAARAHGASTVNFCKFMAR